MRCVIPVGSCWVLLSVAVLSGLLSSCASIQAPDPRLPVTGTIYEQEPIESGGGRSSVGETTTEPEPHPADNGYGTETRRPPEEPSGPTVESVPTAEKIPGKPGFVYSPFSNEKRPVDVRGMPPGMKAQDPYTGSVFLVP